MDNNPLKKMGGSQDTGGGIPSNPFRKNPSGNSNLAPILNDTDKEKAFQTPGFGNAENDEKNGIGNRIEQAKQASKR
jgi:hypothetical protein